MLCLSYFYYNKNISPFVNAYYLKDISDLRYNEEWLEQSERLIRLNKIAIAQMEILTKRYA